MTTQEIYAKYQIDAINDYNTAVKEIEDIFNKNKEMDNSELYDLLASSPLRHSFLDKYQNHIICIKNGSGDIVSINWELKDYVLKLCSDVYEMPRTLINQKVTQKL